MYVIYTEKHTTPTNNNFIMKRVYENHNSCIAIKLVKFTVHFDVITVVIGLVDSYSSIEFDKKHTNP